jgi:hypothetical protein
MQTSVAPSIVLICLLLAVGFVVALVLWATIREDDPQGAASPTTVATTVPPTVAAPVGAVSPSQEPAAAARLTAVTAIKLTGGAGPNAELASAAIDGNTATAWPTGCYSDEFTTAAGGLVATLSAPAGGTLAVDVGSSPFQLWIHTTTEATAPTTVDAWGDPVGRLTGTAPGEQTAELPDGTTFVLVRWIQVGVDPGCDPGRPNRGVLNELTFTPAG